MNIFRSQDAYATLCSLYGEHNAQSLMRTRGACNPVVAKLAMAMGRSRPAIMAALAYRMLPALSGGYAKLMTAARGDGNVKRLLRTVGGGHRYTSWEIDTAIQVLLVVVDRYNGRL